MVNLAEVKIPKVIPNQVRMSQNDWVNYGDNNLFPDFLMESVKKSENHSAFISLRENMFKGSGLSYSDATKGFLEALDEDGTTIEDLWEDWATDMSIMETFAVFVRYNKTKTQIVALDYVDSSKVRPSKTYEVDKDGNPTSKLRGYWVCPDWQYHTQFPPVMYERFNPGNINETTQLHFYHKRANGQPYLPEVSYVSCLNYVQMEDETSKYGLNTMLNGFFASAILSVTASMSDEQKEAFKRNVRDSFTGSENASKLMVMVQESKDGVQVTPISSGDNTNMLKALGDRAQQAIATAHRCHPSLASIQVATGLSSDAALLRTAQEQFQNNVVTHLQKPVVSFLDKVFKFNGIGEADFRIESLNLVSETTPDWFLQDYIKPEVLAAKYGFKKEELLDTLLTPAPAAPAPPSESPYPANVSQ